jgi:hypothetical protein
MTENNILKLNSVLDISLRKKYILETKFECDPCINATTNKTDNMISWPSHFVKIWLICWHDLALIISTYKNKIKNP